MLIKCSRCQAKKSASSFNKNSSRPNGLQDACRECHKAAVKKTKKPVTHRKAQKRYVSKNKKVIAAKQRAYDLMRNYNLTPEQVEEMSALQQRRCLICDKEKKLVVDHSHETGRVRGLLCASCNSKLGWFEAYTPAILTYEL